VEAAWLSGSQAIFALSTLVGVRLLSDLMPPAAYGEVALLVGVLTLGRNLFAYPFLQAAIRFYPEVSGRHQTGIMRSIVRSLLLRSVLLLALVIILVGVPSYGWKPMSLLQLPLMIGLLTVEDLCLLETDLLIAARRPRTYAILRASDACFRAIGAVAMVRWLGPAPAMVLLGYLLGGTLAYAGLFVFRVERVGVSAGLASAAIGPTLPALQALRDRIWRYSVPLIPIAIMDWISGLSGRYFVGGLVGLEAAGIYAATYGLMNQPFAISQTTLELIFRSRYFDAVTGGDVHGARKVFVSWITLQLLICIIGVVAAATLSRTISWICLGAQYQAASRIMPFIAAGTALLALYTTLEKVFHARHITGWCLTLRAVGAGLSVAIGLPLILAAGIFGAALAVPVYYGLQMLMCIAVISKTSRSGPAGRRRVTCDGSS
jgi:O-antigen/teichoic acid export membrane protein